MSLNSQEQRIYEHLQNQPEEWRFWLDKVRTVAAGSDAHSSAASALERELWRYYVERCSAVASFRKAAQKDGLGRTSMLNLAEYLLRLWTEPKPKRKSEPDSSGPSQFAN